MIFRMSGRGLPVLYIVQSGHDCCASLLLVMRRLCCVRCQMARTHASDGVTITKRRNVADMIASVVQRFSVSATVWIRSFLCLVKFSLFFPTEVCKKWMRVTSLAKMSALGALILCDRLGVVGTAHICLTLLRLGKAIANKIRAKDHFLFPSEVV